MIYNWLKTKKAENKISYGSIGKIINYTDVGVSKAISNETLSFEQLKHIAGELGFENEFNSKFKSNNQLTDTGYNHLDQLALEVTRNETELLKIPMFANIIEKHVAKHVAKIFSSNESLQEYLKD